MRIITLNVNGPRSAAAKGFGRWMRRPLLAPRGLHAFLHPAQARKFAFMERFMPRLEAMRARNGGARPMRGPVPC
jgi:hypothetical protein